MNLMELLRRLKPTHLVGQIALLMLVLITSYQILLIVIFHVMDIEGRRHYVSEADFITSVLLGLDAAEPEQRAGFIQEISADISWINPALCSGSAASRPSNTLVIKSASDT